MIVANPIRGWLLAVAGALLLGSVAQAAENGLPSFKDLIKTKEAADPIAGEEEEAPVPRDLKINETNREIQYILPGDALCYLEAPNGKALMEGIRQTALAKLMQAAKVQTFFRTNELGAEMLFSDLPPAYSNEMGIKLLGFAKTLGQSLLENDRRVALAVYDMEGEGMTAVFLADVGHLRAKPFESIMALRDTFMEKTVMAELQESHHRDDYIDVIQGAEGKAQIGFGLIRNYAAISNNVQFVKRLLQVARGGAARSTLSQSRAYVDLASHTDGKSHVRGFVDLHAIQNMMARSGLPTAGEMMNLSADLLGRGNPEARKGPTLLYYDLRSEGDSFVEHLACPTRTASGIKPGLPARVEAVCKTDAEIGPDGVDWISPRLVPYQPTMYLGCHVHPKQFGQFLQIRNDEHFGASSGARALSKGMSQTLLRLFTKEFRGNSDEILTGEVGYAQIGSRQGQSAWLLILAIQNAAAVESRLGVYRSRKEVGGVKIRTAIDQGDWKDGEAFAVFNQSNFKHIKSLYNEAPQSCLVIASSGVVLQDLIEQVTALSSLADNKDFTDSLNTLGRQSSAVIYLNLPGVTGREYVNAGTMANWFYPRITALSNLPPLSLMTKTFAGTAAGLQIEPGAGYVSWTINSTVPTVPGVAGLMALKFPRWVRERARTYVSQSRGNLGRIWLELQTYATQRGHFPQSMSDLRNLFPAKDGTALFTSPAAVEKLGIDAASGSYRYLPGLRATDDPTLPVMYEAEPWHWEFSNWMEGSDVQQESGRYQRYRLVLHLNGNVVAYTEDEFQRRILPRIRARE